MPKEALTGHVLLRTTELLAARFIYKLGLPLPVEEDDIYCSKHDKKMFLTHFKQNNLRILTGHTTQRQCDSMRLSASRLLFESFMEGQGQGWT